MLQSSILVKHCNLIVLIKAVIITSAILGSLFFLIIQQQTNNTISVRWTSNQSTHIRQRRILQQHPATINIQPLSQPFEIVICAIVLKERLYLDEWIQYHRALGFNHIYLYDNSLDYEMNILNDRYSGFVTVKHFPGKNMQYPAYNDFRERHRTLPMWVIDLDCDEFVNLYKHRDIRSFMHTRIETGAAAYPNMTLGQISINWFQFGSNNQTEYSPLPVVQRFTMRRPVVDRCPKSFVYLPHSLFMRLHCHDMRGVDLLWVDGDGRRQTKCFHQDYLNETGTVAAIHHYHTKSKAEWELKRARGLADKADITYHANNFHHHNYQCNVFDDRAWQFFKAHVLHIQQGNFMPVQYNASAAVVTTHGG